MKGRLHEATAVAAMGRMDELERLINESYSFEDPLRPGYTMNAALLELRNHGHLESARSLSERQLAWIETLPPETQMGVTVSNWIRVALRAQGRHEAAAQIEARFQKAWNAADVTLTASRFMGKKTTALAVVDAD